LASSQAARGIACAGLALLAIGCQARSAESAELVLRGSIAESSEVVQLDPVFLARQKQIETRFFGFESDTPAASQDALGSEEDVDVDVAIAPSTVAPSAAFGGLSLQWPILGRVTSPYGMRRGRLHAGVDIKGNKGDPIYAAADGQILTAKRRNAYGKVVIVGHENDHQTLYAHMTAFAVREGQYVRTGELVGYVGATGRATGNHLHFETRVNGGVPQDPLRFLPDVQGKGTHVSLSLDDSGNLVREVVLR
jgi:murein DD-endopeptidase MepM/ murein hydrolase activator NlpD